MVRAGIAYGVVPGEVPGDAEIRSDFFEIKMCLVFLLPH